MPWALLTSKDVCLLLLLEDARLAVTTIILKTNIIVKLTGRRMLGFNSFRHTFYVVGSCQWWRMVDFKFISLVRSRAHVRPDLSIWLLGDHFSLNGNYPDLAPYSTWRDVDFEIRAESRLQIPHFFIHSFFLQAHSKDLIYFSNHLLGAFEKWKLEVICNPTSKISSN